MASKSTRAFRTISEASDELDLKPHVLRFWEAKFPDLTPLTRAGGRRFYRPEDIDFLRGLRILLHDERHKIKDVQKLIKVRGAQSVVELGQSAVNTRPSRPIEERDLVPERINPTIIKPADVIKPAYVAPAQPVVAAPQPVPVPEPVVVQFTPSTAPTPQPQAPIQPQAQPQQLLQPQPAPESAALSSDETDQLEGALDRLSALRSRWKKFT